MVGVVGFVGNRSYIKCSIINYKWIACHLNAVRALMIANCIEDQIKCPAQLPLIAVLSIKLTIAICFVIFLSNDE